MNPVLANVLYLALPFACVSAILPASRPSSFAERLVFGVALYEFLLLGVGLALGSANCLTPLAYGAALGCASLALVAQGVRNGFTPKAPRAWRVLKTSRGLAALLLCGAAAAAWLLELAFDLKFGTRHGDGLWYHIPRVMFWMDQGNFKPWDTPVVPSIGLPVGADLVLLHKMLLGQGWAGAAFATLALAAAAVACVYLGGVELGLKRSTAVQGALLFASFPAVGLRIWSVNSDIAAAFPALASFVALHRVRSPRVGLSLFLVLNAMALACKPTVAPPAAVLACVALWRCRRRVAAAWRDALPWASAVLGAVLVVCSYWPVYEAFGDFFGAEFTRAHRSAGAPGFLRAVGLHTAYWALEPLGYVTRFRAPWEGEALRSIYNALGAGFSHLPDLWKPYPGQDSGCTGLIPLLLAPVLCFRLPPRWRGPLVLALLAQYLPLSGMIRPQPYFVRYDVLLLATLALLWCGNRLFAGGRRRWLLVAAVSLNLAALLGIVSVNIYLHSVRWSRDGGIYSYITEEDRQRVAASLAGRPLLVLTEAERVSSMDALLPGPREAFRLRYVICPAEGGWTEQLRRVSSSSNWLAFVHNGRDTMIPGPAFARRGSHRCSEVPRPLLEDALVRAGWSRYRRGNLVDLWTLP